MKRTKKFFNVVNIENDKEYILNGMEFSNINDAIEYAYHYTTGGILKIKKVVIEEEIIDFV